jgi:hypothetical protein
MPPGSVAAWIHLAAFSCTIVLRDIGATISVPL